MRPLLALALVACGASPHVASPGDVTFAVPAPREGDVIVMTQDSTDQGLGTRVSHREVRMTVRGVLAERVMRLEATFLASTENGEPDLLAGSTVIIRRGEEPRTVFESGVAVSPQQAGASEGVVSEFLSRPPLPTLLGSRGWPLNQPAVLTPREAALFESGEEGEARSPVTLTIVSVAAGVATITIDRSSADDPTFRAHGDIRFDVTRGRIASETWSWQGRRGDDVEPMHDFSGTLAATYAFE